MAEKNMNNKRIREVDIFKGICIFLVVMGHSWAPFSVFIYMFHMPAFFVVSGYTYKNTSNIVYYVKKKTKTLLLPFWVCNTIFIFLYELFEIIGVLDKVTLRNTNNLGYDLKMLFLNGNASELGGASWFLLVLFGGSILYMIFDRAGQLTSYKLTLLLSCLTTVAGWIMIKRGYGRIYSFDLILFSVGFIALGDFLKRFQILQKCVDHKILFILSILVAGFFGSYYFRGTLPMNWPTRTFDDSLFTQFLAAVAPMYLCWLTACVMRNLTLIGDLFEYIGKRTFTILVYQFVVFKLMFVLFAFLKITNWTYINELTPIFYPSGILWLVLPLLNIIFCCLFSKLSERKMLTDFLVNAKLGGK